jgi:hypothetical protein
MEPVPPYDPDAPVPPSIVGLIWRGVKAWVAIALLAVIVLAVPFNTVLWVDPPSKEKAARPARENDANKWDPRPVRTILLCAALLVLAAAAFPATVWPSATRRYAMGALVTIFVLWHVFFLAFRNPIDLWWEDVEKWLNKKTWWTKDGDKKDAKSLEQEFNTYFKPADKLTRGYGRFFGIEQGWSMFTPNMARGVSFMAARIEFTDHSEVVIRSPNEPVWEADDASGDAKATKLYKPKPFFRLGGWRQRKLEDELAFTTPDDLPQKDDLPLFARYVQWSVRRWREANPEDKRKPERVVLIRRRFPLPPYNEEGLMEVMLDRMNEMPRADQKTQPPIYREPEIYTIGYFNPDGTLRP